VTVLNPPTIFELSWNRNRESRMKREVKERANFIATEIADKYGTADGNAEIASRKALRVIGNLYGLFVSNHKNPIQVIEIGSGIGTISSLLLDINDQQSYLLYEKDKWCVNQIAKNVISTAQISLDSSFSMLLSHIDKSKPTFLIIDDFITPEETSKLLIACMPEIIIIEGHRFRQRKAVSEALLKLNSQSYIKFLGNSSDSIKGCVIFYKIYSTSWFARQVSKFSHFRLTIQSLLYVRKLFQFIGIRKRRVLQTFV
jgi:hypothetical protein